MYQTFNYAGKEFEILFIQDDYCIARENSDDAGAYADMAVFKNENGEFKVITDPRLTAGVIEGMLFKNRK